MTVDIDKMTMTEKADAAFKQAAIKVIERARQTGTPIILWENGRIVKRSWEELIGDLPKTPDQTSEASSEDRRDRTAGHARGEAAEERIG